MKSKEGKFPKEAFSYGQRPSKIQVLDKDKSTNPALKILITQEAFQKIKSFIDLCGYEINGLGVVERDGNTFTITDVFILDQIAEPAHVTIDPKALNRCIYELVSGGGEATNLKFQWHSHVDMPAFFSYEDITTIGRYMNDFMISFVSNKRGECSCRLDIYKPLYLSLELPLYVKIPLTNHVEISEKCQEDMIKHVKVKGVFKDKPIKPEITSQKEYFYVEASSLLYYPED